MQHCKGFYKYGQQAKFIKCLTVAVFNYGVQTCLITAFLQMLVSTGFEEMNYVLGGHCYYHRWLC